MPIGYVSDAPWRYFNNADRKLRQRAAGKRHLIAAGP
jgi:hypothetical protein